MKEIPLKSPKINLYLKGHRLSWLYLCPHCGIVTDARYNCRHCGKAGSDFAGSIGKTGKARIHEEPEHELIGLSRPGDTADEEGSGEAE